MSHLGRPDGAPDPQYSLAPVAQRLGELLGRTVVFSSRHRRRGRRRTRSLALEDGAVVLLENLRFHPGEASKSDDERRSSRRSSRLSAMPSSRTASASCIASRRASTSSKQQLPSAAGLLIAAELDVLDRLTENPRSPTRSCSAGRRCPTSSASSGTCCLAWIAAHRRRNAVHLPRGPGPQGRCRACSRPTSSTSCAATSPRPSASGSRSCCRRMSWSPRSSAQTRRSA